MQIDLNKEIEDQFRRVRELADDAIDDNEQGLSARASAMGPLTSMLRELTKSQEALINMAEITKLESAVIETMKEVCDEKQYEYFIKALEERFNKHE